MPILNVDDYAPSRSLRSRILERASAAAFERGGSLEWVFEASADTNG